MAKEKLLCSQKNLFWRSYFGTWIGPRSVHAWLSKTLNFVASVITNEDCDCLFLIQQTKTLDFVLSIVTSTMKAYVLFVAVSLVLLPMWYLDPKWPVPGKSSWICHWKTGTNWQTPVYRRRFGKLCIVHLAIVFILAPVSHPNFIVLEGASSVDSFIGKWILLSVLDLPWNMKHRWCLTKLREISYMWRLSACGRDRWVFNARCVQLILITTPSACMDPTSCCRVLRVHTFEFDRSGHTPAFLLCLKY